MKILHVNTTDYGGAATAIVRIHLALLEKGVDSKILFLKKTKDISQGYAFGMRPKSHQTFSRKLLTKVTAKLKFKVQDDQSYIKKFPSVEVFSYPTTPYDLTEHELYREADIIQLNWVSGFLDEPSFFRKNRKPVIWRMADLYACGGGYHYETAFPFDDLSHLLEKNVSLRKKALAGRDVTMVPISNWVKMKAERSEVLADFPMRVIHNGLDLRKFRLLEKDFAREVFSLPKEGRIILFGADHVANKRKGFNLLLDALSLLKLPDDVSVCVFGSSKSELPCEIKSIGRIDDERLLALLYAAADYFINPSVEEAFGQVTIEALACGTPVVSFPTGGSIDIINQGSNGILAEAFTAKALAEAVSLALRTSFERNQIRKDVEERFNIAEKAAQYIQLYNELMSAPFSVRSKKP